MKVKTLAAAVAIMISSGVQATDYSFGDVTGTQVNDVNSVGVGAFIDNLFFSISFPSIGTGVLSNVIVNTPTTPLYDIDGLTATLWADLGTAGISDAGDFAIPGTTISGDYIENSGLLATGNYYFQVTGTGTGSAGGQYFYNAAAVPVPEPTSWAMLLAGLGLVGLQLRRMSRGGSPLAS